MSPPRQRVAILLAWNQDPRWWAARFARNEVRDPTPYGYERAGREFDIEWCRSKAEGKTAKWLRRRTAGYLGFDLIHAWRNRRTIFAADVVWTHTEREHLAVALLQRMRVKSRRTQVIAQSVWLWDAWEKYGRLRRAFVAWLLRTNGIELVHSSINLRTSRELVPGRRVERIPFGTSLPLLPPKSGEDSEAAIVLAVGNDIDRDWVTLSEVARVLPDVRFRVASSNRKAKSINWPANVTVAPTATINELDNLYGVATVIVVPTTPNSHASGATSLIEALAVGCPVITTRSGGIEEYASTDALLIPANNGAALTEAITAALNGRVDAPAPNGLLLRGLTQADYVQRYILVTQWLLGLIAYPTDAFRFVAQTAASGDADES